MKKEPTIFERHMKCLWKKEKQKSDQSILDAILRELKEKHDRERKEKVGAMQHQLKKSKDDNSG